MSQCDCSSSRACSTKSSGLKRMGLRLDSYDYIVALAGNPNTGKSTVFNNLTGLRQHTGNWPGKTISRAEGGFSLADKDYKVVDLPGTYSLMSATHDEEVARDFLLFGKPDVTVIVVDATALERNLNLAIQVLQITDKAVLALNLMDEAKAHNIEIDVRGLSRDLGIPVVPMSARRREGMDALLAEIKGIAEGEVLCKPKRLQFADTALKRAMNSLSALVESVFPALDQPDWVSLRLLDGDTRIQEAVRSGEIGVLQEDHAAEEISVTINH